MRVFSQLIRAQLENLDADPASPAQGHIYFNTTLGKFKVYNETAGEWDTIQPQIAYIENGDAESSTDGWATYADAAAATPVDGTGGAANVTLTRSVSNPLRGAASFLLTKDAVNRQGEGASYDFVIDFADRGQDLAVRFDYEIGGSFVPGVSSDVQVFIWDDVNLTLVALSSSTIDSTSGRFDATFTADAASTNYRLIFHVATTSALAWTLKLDRVSVSPDISVAPVVSTVPTGCVFDYAGSTEPPGYLFCNGIEVSRTTYAALFAVIGEDYGNGDGSTTFNLPDVRGRVIAGKDDMGGVSVPAFVTLHSNFQDNTASADFSLGSPTITNTACTLQTKDASIQIYIPGAVGAAFSYETTGNVAQDTFGVTFWHTPNHNNGVGGGRRIVASAIAPSTHFFELFHGDGGVTNVTFSARTTGGTVSNVFLGTLAFVLDQQYFFEVYLDAPNGEAWVWVGSPGDPGMTLLTGAAIAIPVGTMDITGVGGAIYHEGNGANEIGWFDNITYRNTIVTAPHAVPTKASTEYSALVAGRLTSLLGGVDGVTLGASGGNEAITLAGSNLGAHTHSFGATTGGGSNHAHNINGNLSSTLLALSTAAGGNGPFWLNGGSQDVSLANENNHTHSVSGTTGSTGSAVPHANVQPTLVANKIIKT